MLSESKSDEIAYKEIELHKQEARINNAMASNKIDQVHVKRYLERLVDEEKKAQLIMKEWVDKKSEQNKAVKDDMLRKYLRSRQDNEHELERTAARLRPRRLPKKALDMDHADHYDDEDVPLDESRDLERREIDHDEYDDDEDDSQLGRLRDLKRRIQ